MARRACFLVLVAVSLFLADADARQPQSTSIRSGVVRADDSGRPLPGARLVARRGGTGIGQAVSDEQGRFQILVPDDADVDLTVTKAGWAPFRMSLRGAPAAEPLDVRLTPGAVITGRVVDGTGTPVVAINIRVRPLPEPGAAPGAWRTVSTNDLGEYRIGSLPAGEYEVGLPVREARPAVVRLQPGRESHQDLARPETPEATTQTLAQAAEGMARLFLGESLTSRSGRPPIDPETAGRVSGVVTGPDARPARTAIVTLVSREGAAAPAMIAAPDGEGRYAFEDVAPGTYRIVAIAPGALQTEYGETATTRTGRAVEVRQRQHVDRLDITLTRAAVIAGRVVDLYGEPLEGLRVAAWQGRTYGDRLVLTPVVEADSSTTDDRGEYRLHGLMPGRYYLVASESEDPVRPPAGRPMEEIVRFATSMALARISAPLRPHTYHPGGAIKDAVPVQVDVGLDALGLETTFAPSPGAAVSGVVLGPDGSPLRAQVTLSVSRRSGAPAIPPYRTASAADGTFTFPFVAPGEYVVQAEAERPGGVLASVVSASLSAFSGNVTGVNVTGGGGTTDLVSRLGGVSWTAENVPPFGSAFVQVAGTEPVSVTLRAAIGSTFGGRVTFKGPARPDSPAPFAIGFATADTDLTRAAVPAARAAEDGTIEAVGLIGPLRVVASATPDGWWLESVYIDGVNAVHEPVTFGTASQSRRDVEVVFSSAPAGLRGQVVSRSGSLVPAATVLAFPSDWTRWHAGTRYVRQAAVTNGQYELAALPPGQYYVAAVDAVTAAMTEWQEPDALNGVIPFARLVTVREGSLSDERLTLAELPR